MPVLGIVSEAGGIVAPIAAVLLQPEMRAVLVGGVELGSDQAFKLTFIDRDHVV